MRDQDRITLSRLLLEGVVVVASILIAFAIDAWWDGRQEARARNALLNALRSDAIVARAEVMRVRSGMVRGMEGTEAFLALADGAELTADDAPRVDTIGTALFLTPSFDAPTGSLQALLAGGDLSYVDNQEIIQRITRLLSLVANLEREQRVLVDTVSGIRETLNALGIDVTRIVAQIDTDLWSFPTDAAETALWRHAGDARLRSLVLTSWVRYRLCETTLAHIDDEYREILAAIESQLGAEKS
jgi:hypothetical protein